MDGLAQQYGDRVTFQRHSENSREAATLMRKYLMPGHGFVAVDAQGRAVWKSIGHSATRAQLEAAIQTALGAD